MLINPLDRVKTTVINEKTFQITMLPALEGMKIARKLAQVALPTMGAFYQGTVTESLNFEMLAVTIVEEMNAIELEEIIVRLLKDMAVNGQAVGFDEYFMANYGELTAVVTFAIKENFGSFFEAKGLFDKYLPKVENKTSDQK